MEIIAVLPIAAVRCDYFVALQSNGTAPFQWMIVKGKLPDGLCLDATNGSLTGIPSKPGAYTFRLECSDSQNNMTYQECLLSVQSDPGTIAPTSKTTAVQFLRAFAPYTSFLAFMVFVYVFSGEMRSLVASLAERVKEASEISLPQIGIVVRKQQESVAFTFERIRETERRPNQIGPATLDLPRAVRQDILFYWYALEINPKEESIRTALNNACDFFNSFAGFDGRNEILKSKCLSLKPISKPFLDQQKIFALQNIKGDPAPDHLTKVENDMIEAWVGQLEELGEKNSTARNSPYYYLSLGALYQSLAKPTYEGAFRYEAVAKFPYDINTNYLLADFLRSENEDYHAAFLYFHKALHATDEAIKLVREMEKRAPPNDTSRIADINELLNRYNNFRIRCKNQAAFSAALGKIHLAQALEDASESYNESRDRIDSHRYADTYAFTIIQKAIADITQGKPVDDLKEIQKKVNEAVTILDEGTEHAIDNKDYKGIPYLRTHKELGEEVLKWLNTLI